MQALAETFVVYQRELERGPGPKSPGSDYDIYRSRVPELALAAHSPPDAPTAVARVNLVTRELAPLERALGLAACAAGGGPP